MLDEKQLKSLEDQLTDPIAERVRKEFGRRYGIWLTAFAAAAGIFGLNAYWDIDEYKAQINDLEAQIESVDGQIEAVGAGLEQQTNNLADLVDRLELAEKSVNQLDEVVEQVSKTTRQVEEAQNLTIEVEDTISSILNRNFNFVIESAAQIYAALPKANKISFYTDAQRYATENNDQDLFIFSTVRLAQAYNGEKFPDAAREEYRKAEKVAREQFLSAEPMNKRAALAELLKVLMTRADDESFYFGDQVALLTLETKALRLALREGAPQDISLVYAQMADVHSRSSEDQGSLELASTYFSKAIEAYGEITYDDDISAVVAELYRKRGVNFMALHALNSDPNLATEAISALKNAVEHARSAGSHLQIYNSSTRLAEA